MFQWLKQVLGAPLQFMTRPSHSSLPTADLHANLSDLAYKSSDEADRHARSLGYKVDRSLSNPNATTFVNDRGEAIISYRGTQLTNPDDLSADLHILTGSRKHKRFDDALDLARRVKSKYSNVQATGHSLGGTQALHVNKNLGIPVHAYNPGATFGDVVDSDNARVVRRSGDLVSKALRVKRGQDVKIPTTRGGVYDPTPLGFLNQTLRAHSLF